jgi:hypothetical protein
MHNNDRRRKYSGSHTLTPCRTVRELHINRTPLPPQRCAYEHPTPENRHSRACGPLVRLCRQLPFRYFDRALQDIQQPIKGQIQKHPKALSSSCALQLPSAGPKGAFQLINPVDVARLPPMMPRSTSSYRLATSIGTVRRPPAATSPIFHNNLFKTSHVECCLPLLPGSNIICSRLCYLICFCYGY